MTTRSKIETERLTLRRWRPEDAAALAAMHAHPEVTAWLARGPMSVDEASDVIARFDAHFEAHGFGVWAVERRADATLIALCGLSHETRVTHPMTPCVEIMWRQAHHAWGMAILPKRRSRHWPTGSTGAGSARSSRGRPTPTCDRST
nr:GNAT family N-acetyltransferase [Burkholderia stabilis]